MFLGRFVCASQQGVTDTGITYRPTGVTDTGARMVRVTSALLSPRVSVD